MVGTDAATGKSLGGLAHLRQSVADILTTPIGTRVMRRDYGSRLFELVDAPINRSTLLQMYEATADALKTWEPRLKVEKVIAESAEPGQVTLSITGVYLPDGKPVTLDGLVVTR
jgi:phage baseplate assembly protein W